MILRVLVAAFIVMLIIPVVAQPTSAHIGTYRVQAGNGLNLRTGPGGGYARIETMANGTLVKARGHSGNWMKLTSYSSGRTGWASLTYLVPAGGSSGGTTSTPSLQLCWDTSFNWTACAPYWIAQTIYNAALRWGAPYWALMGIAACESGFDPNAYNSSSGVSGIFQFQPSTMAWIYPGGNVWSVYDSANAAAKMLSMGLSSHFDCSWRIGY
jgi:uncharacterized protein YraI